MKIFSFDAETDGLYGPVWAVGAVVLGWTTASTPDEVEVATFSGQLDPAVVTDKWTRTHVVPAVDLPRYDAREELLDGFWRFWLDHSAGNRTIAVADCGYPVETGLFRACVELAPEVRWNQGPFPLHELSTLLLAKGLDPELDRREFVARPDLVAHDPVADAMVQGLCWVKASGTVGSGHSTSACSHRATANRHGEAR